jgi:hypothetical protein
MCGICMWVRLEVAILMPDLRSTKMERVLDLAFILYKAEDVWLSPGESFIDSMV